MVRAEPTPTPPLGKDYFSLRGALDNCRLQFLNEKKGRVAFLGGSITAMNGWRDLTCEMLKKRFAETQFEFNNAGVGGTNSTLGAFRLENDVFKNGPVDLLFLEYAVNDDGGTDEPDNRPARAIEGIIRHARRENPKIDIVIQYFADTVKVGQIRKGAMPAIILKHDAVAEHYAIPTINMATEMTRRIDAGEFTWEQFSKDTCHPSTFGHDRYAECIGAFLDAAWKSPVDAAVQPKDFPLPEPMDKLNYETGHFIDLGVPKIAHGWNRIPKWDTEKKCNYGGAVDILAGEQPGAELTLAFEGTLIGIYAIAGMDAGVLECAVDGGPPHKVDLFDGYCAQFHRPVCRTLAEELPHGKHVLTLRIADEKNEKSLGHAARILKFTTN
jgi:lysophospholipase L1-like esterase